MFTNGLLRSNPPIEGLHESIVINSRRLHLTLGVMAFSDNATLNPSTSPSGSAVPARQTTSHPKSLAAAQALLASLRPHIRALLNSDSDSSSPANPVRDGAARREIGDGSARSRKLKLKLNRMDIMKPERAPHRLRSDADEQEQGAEGEGVYGRVLWVGPDTSNINVEGGVDGDADTRRLHGVCTFINRQFMDAGLVMDERRPLKLHCTIANTTYRKPRPKSHAHNLPFSYSAILASPAFKTISTSRNRDVSDSQHQQQACLNRSERVVIRDGQMGQVNIDKGKGNESKPKERARGRGVPVPVDLGVWEVGEVQICEMGSHGPEGEYVCVARCEF
ncbi:hypothetical protein FIBSPDRAFT_847711 [Athelia psychrophila]|uniref:A-kinase anchor protein 7-like phosphoesterase domain-containing protein n=1 Tax=Athelia psychrophila TaxID=1759441 RepID=A0A166VVB8_9AGAM|nr:hypothetical protein FIBSPDRAFT_847711 [Fibularhizoctonia sp. CBS 109695]